MPKSFKLSLVVKGILISALCALVLSLLFSFILAFTRTPESELSLNIILGISIFCGSALTSYQAGAKGLYYGLAVGVGFMLFLLVVSAIFVSSSPSWLGFGEKTVISLVCSAVGGIMGAILKR
ncbi:TIGR04086 family membrane protein [Desulfitobacterium sp.]|uniref:TIGR04086 family membrane protein n=1 Tax=Desulfitobacterium sp. TaxID=49981 RepID=UPI002C4A16DF|nr:TIGR04086 family membrane protein [Desulfitobacterium sp.]HVJ48693.1 TIGR04086 family membrane protein [Desulfitobacterium sp.]